MMYILAMVMIVLFMGLVIIKYGYYKPIPDEAFLITGVIGTMLSMYIVLDWIINFIISLIRKLRKYANTKR